MPVQGWTDGGLTWGANKRGQISDWRYYETLMKAFAERLSASVYGYDLLNPPSMPEGYGPLPTASIPVRGTVLLHVPVSPSNSPWYSNLPVLSLDISTLSYFIGSFWWDGAWGHSWYGSGIWADSRTISYTGTYSAPSLWTPTTFRAYLEDNYGYGSKFDLLRNNPSPWPTTYYSFFRFRELDWAWMHFFYVCLNLFTVHLRTNPIGGVYGGILGDRHERAWDENTFAEAVTNFNANTTTYHYASEDASKVAGHWCEYYSYTEEELVEVFTIFRRQPYTTAVMPYQTPGAHPVLTFGTVPWESRKVIVGEMIKYNGVSPHPHNSPIYENNDLPYVESETYILLDQTDNVQSANSDAQNQIWYPCPWPAELDLIDNDATVTGQDKGWLLKYRHQIYDVGIATGFTYQDDTV